jgi:hypothetical protein
MKGGVYKRKVDKQDELLDAAARTKERKSQLRRTGINLRTQVANCIYVDGGIFENLS